MCEDIHKVDFGVAFPYMLGWKTEFISVCMERGKGRRPSVIAPGGATKTLIPE